MEEKNKGGKLRPWTDAEKKAQGKRAKALWDNPKWVEEYMLAHTDPKYIAVCKKRGKDQWDDPIYREKTEKAMKESWDENRRTRQSEITKTLWQDPIWRAEEMERRKKWQQSPEYKAKCKKRAKDLWEDPIYVEKTLKAKKDAHITLSQKRKDEIGKRSKELWQDPIWRDNTIKKQKENHKDLTEEQWIKIRQALASVPPGMLGKHQTQKAKDLIRDFQRTRERTEEEKHNNSLAQTKRAKEMGDTLPQRTEEWKSRVRQKLKGKKRPQEVCDAISRGKKGMTVPMERRKRISATLTQQRLDGKRPNFKQGKFVSTKNDYTFKYSSSYELRQLELLEADPLVASYDYECLKISYKAKDGSSHYTIPDFLITYTDGTQEIREIKSSYFLAMEEHQYKINVIREYAKKNGYKFSVWTEVELGLNGHTRYELK